MKIWKSFSGDHSSKLKIVGEFKHNDDLQKFKKEFEELVKLIDGNEYFSYDEFMESEAYKRNKGFGSLINENDFEGTCYFDSNEVEIKKDNKILLETDDFNIQFILKLIINNSGKVEVLSYHSYPEEYNKTNNM